MAWTERTRSKIETDLPSWVSDGVSIFQAVWVLDQTEETMTGHFLESDSNLRARVTHIWDGTNRPESLPVSDSSEASIVEEELRKREG